MTPPTRRAHIAAIRERDARMGEFPTLEPRGLGTSYDDRRYLLGVVGELAAALRFQWLRTNKPSDVHILLDELGLWLADLGPDE